MTATVLLTRPLAQSTRFAAALRARLGPVPVVISPVLDIVPDPEAAARALVGAGGLIFTSENGVAACQGLTIAPGLPAYCVGTRTAQAAEALGGTVRIGPGDLGGLVAMIVAEGWPQAAPLVHLHGTHVTGDAAAQLATHGIPARGAIVYDQTAQALDKAAGDLLQGEAPVLVPIFSARSARLLVTELDKATAPLRIVAISPAVARELPVHSDRQVSVAGSPDATSVLEALVALWEDGCFLEQPGGAG